MKYQIEMQYKITGNRKVLFTSDWLDAEMALLTGEQLEKSGKATDLSFIDEMNSSWSLKELRKLSAEIEEEPHDIKIYFDGGFNKDTSEAGLGAIIYYKQGKKNFRLRANELIEQMDTNNEAEYAALYFALNLLQDLGVHHLPVEIKGDSQVVLKQLEGEWPCFEDNLNRWLDRIEGKMKQLGIEPLYEALPRKENKEADRLATQALEGTIINSTIEIN
ncbi:reverse transcriptase-like protein [Robertmurraya yapensis]|uniref:Reverse transcriptase-like protein n=2 Tax=Bacillaceae TaxID=186817 RepID=A0A3S0KHB4_9BACI|nr:ribonuclease H family protein [Bacillus yapensis]RTR30518.1 reverse transcriptase-like protein [Bacillus yapensis]TKS95337.1 reverse transcriptase-like protein [Bacillus yapensis]